MNVYIGSWSAGATVRHWFNTTDTAGAPITFAGSPVVQVYKDGGTTEDNSGITLTVDFDLRTGLHHLAIDTSSDTVFYVAGSEFCAVVTTGTVNAISVVGKALCQFSLTT